MATAGHPVNRIRQYESGAPTNIGHINVNDMERLVSLMGGAVLTAYGLSRGNLAGLGLAALGGGLLYRGATGHCNMYDALGVNTAEPHNPRASIPAGHGVKMEESITVNRPVSEVFRVWRNFSNLPKFMSNLESVEVRDHTRSHWVAKGPLGKSVAWDAEVITERDNELIGWRSLEGSEVDTAGSVHFKSAPGGQATEIQVTLKYNPPAGKAGAALAWLLGDAPEQQISEDLRRFKEMMESRTGGF